MDILHLAAPCRNVPVTFTLDRMAFLRPKLAKRLALTCGLLFAAGLFFRFAIYRHMYIAPDAPFGISDLIEAALGFVLMGALGVAGVTALAMLAQGPRENRVAALWLLVVCASIVVLAMPLHTLAARWAP